MLRSILLTSCLAACATESPTPPGDDSPPADAGPVPMVVNFGTEVGPGTDVELIEVGRWQGGQFHNNTYYTNVALQVKLKGTATGPSGSEMRINLASTENVYAPGRPGQEFGYQDSTIDINSDTFTAGSCGSWTNKQLTYDLKCEVPASGQATSWTYSEARSFVYVLDPVQDTYTFVIDVRAFKNNDDSHPVQSDAVACRRLIRTETRVANELGYDYTRTDTNAPCS